MADAPTRPLPEHVTQPLLSLITQRSLDADYEHVAARKRAAGTPPETRQAPRRTAAVVLLVFGALVTVAAVQTSQNANVSDANRASLIDQVNVRRQAVSDLQKQLSTEQARVLVLQRSITAQQTKTRATQAALDRVAQQAGFGPLRGSGVKVTVANPPNVDPSQMIRDSDLALLTNALWASGAQAISVNGKRVTGSGAFRNVGFQVLLNSQPINAPYVFSVIGNPGTLPANLLSTSAGARWYALKDSLGFRFDVTNGGTMTVPAAPTPTLRSARLAPTKNLDQRTQGDSGS
ncbi:MAG: DUF881 domain-containing protein [Nocardioides sp.]